MKNITLNFEFPLVDVAICPTNDPEYVAQRTRGEALETLASVSSQLSAIDKRLSEQFSLFQDQLIGLSANVAQQVLQSDDELIERRLRQYVELGMECSPNVSVTSIAVHPSCVDYLSEWTKESELSSIRVVPDASISRGDCRLEHEDQGFWLSLESQLQSIVQHLINGDRVNSAERRL